MAKRKMIEERSEKDIEWWLKSLPDVKGSIFSTIQLLQTLQLYLETKERPQDGSERELHEEALKVRQETNYLLVRLQEAAARSEEMISKLATSSTTAATDTRGKLSRELKSFLEHVSEINLRTVSALDTLGARIKDTRVKTMISELSMKSRTTADFIRSINADEFASVLYIAQEKARQARTALANRDSRVKAVLKSIYESKVDESSIVDVKIGTDSEKLQQWLDEVFKHFVASRPKQNADLLTKTYKKEWDIFTKSALSPALSPSNLTSVHEKKLNEFFSLSEKWSSQNINLDQLNSIKKSSIRPDFVHESGAQLNVKSRARDLIKMRLNPSDSLAFVFTFPASLSSRIDELEFKLLNASRAIPNVGKVEVFSRLLPTGHYELSIDFPASDSFESVEKLKQLIVSVVDPFLS